MYGKCLSYRRQSEVNEVQVGPDKLEVVASFCYLVTLFLLVEAVQNGHYSRENSLEEVQGATTSSHIPPPLYKTRDHVYSSCLRSAMIHASETWLLTKMNLQRNDRAMIRLICSIKPEGEGGGGREAQKLIGKDCHEWKTVDPQERSTWRSGVRSAMRAATQLHVRGPTDVDDLIKNLIIMMMRQGQVTPNLGCRLIFFIKINTTFQLHKLHEDVGP